MTSQDKELANLRTKWTQIRNHIENEIYSELSDTQIRQWTTFIERLKTTASDRDL
jgi:hypothetical protein